MRILQTKTVTGSVIKMANHHYLPTNLIFLLAVSFAAPLFIGCDKNIDNKPQAEPMVNGSYEAKMNKIEKNIDALSSTALHQEEGYKLSYETQKSTHDYLGKLYANITSTPPEALPEWEEIYLALTSDEALMSSEFVLGRPGKVTNFYKHQQLIVGQEEKLNTHQKKIAEHDGALNAQAILLNTHDQVMARMEKVMLDANAEVTAQLKVLADSLGNFESRIKTMEAQNQEMKQTVSNFDGRVKRLETSVEGIRAELNTYNLYGMSQDIKALQQNFTEATQRIQTLEGDVGKNKTDIAKNIDDLGSTNKDLSTVNTTKNKLATEIQLLKKEINDGSNPKIAEIAERLVALEKEVGLPIEEDPNPDPTVDPTLVEPVTPPTP